MPYVEAKARWWQGLAILATASESDREAARAAARAPLAEAYRIARLLPSLPLLRAVIDLSGRARVTLPFTDEPIPGGVEVPIGQPVGTVARVRSPRARLVAVGPGLDVAARAGHRPDAVAVGPGLARRCPGAVDGGDRPGHRGACHRRIAARSVGRLRPQPARARGPDHRGRGADRPRDRRPTLHQRAHRARARPPGPRQARRRQPDRGGRLGHPPGPCAGRPLSVGDGRPNRVDRERDDVASRACIPFPRGWSWPRSHSRSSWRPVPRTRARPGPTRP